MNISPPLTSARWLVALLAIAGLVGCAAPGEDENYKELQRSPDIFHDEPVTGSNYSHARPAPPIDPNSVKAPPAPGAFDRSDWPAITFGPANGHTSHAPNYYSDVALDDDAINPLSAPNPVWQMNEALSGEKPGNWNGDNLTQLAIAPLAFGLTTLSVPVQAICCPPWQQVTTPPAGSNDLP